MPKAKTSKKSNSLMAKFKSLPVIGRVAIDRGFGRSGHASRIIRV